MKKYKYSTIAVTVFGVRILKGFGEAQYQINCKAKDILEANKIEFYGLTDNSYYWLVVREENKERALKLVGKLAEK